jgi:hypothetical protein
MNVNTQGLQAHIVFQGELHIAISTDGTYNSNGIELHDQLRQGVIVLQTIEEGHRTSPGHGFRTLSWEHGATEPKKCAVGQGMTWQGKIKCILRAMFSRR